MKYKKFFVPFLEDERMMYAKKYLENNDFVCTDNKKDADFILLPVPTKDYMLKEFEDKLVFCAKNNCKNGFDYMKNKSYVDKNAFLTAEGTIVLIEENTDYSLLNANVLILGYGRIAKNLHTLLNAYGANVTICSRSEDSKIKSELNGAKHIYFSDLKNKFDADIIINTVPKIILSKDELINVKKDSIIIDLASFPGGVDKKAISDLGLTLINGNSMPSRYTKKTAGYIIGETVKNILKEEFN